MVSVVRSYGAEQPNGQTDQQYEAGSFASFHGKHLQYVGKNILG
jgi:hypothetical protein